MPTTTQTFDVYGSTDRLDPATLDVMATRLEARGKAPVFGKMLHDYLDAMEIDEADSVLDLGCGTGFAARGIAARSGFSGRVTGIDLSDYLVDRAQDLAQQEGVSAQVEFRAGDTQSLDLPENAYDAVVAHTVASHVQDPLAALREMARVVKPGGAVGVFDGDYASLTFSHPDSEAGKQYDELIISAIITQPRVMREMPRLLAEAGLELVTTFPYVVSDVGKADYWTPALESFRKLVPKSGAVDEAEANAWVDERFAESERGVFFGSSNYYGYVARKPVA